MVLAGGYAQAEETCATLCSADFYVTAGVEDIQQAIDMGVDVNARDEVGKSALHWVAGANPGVITALITAGGDVNAKDKWDRMPLHFVAATGTVENIKLLLDAGAEVNAPTANDWTPLHGAAKFGRAENVVVLLEAGADATARTEMGESALDFGIANPQLAESEALKLLETEQ